MSKRTLDLCEEGEDCDPQSTESELEEEQEEPQLVALRVPLPYPIYMESYDDSKEEDPSPLAGVPVPTQFIKEEKHWVRTWDKETTGLPPIVGEKEASAAILRRQRLKKKRRRRIKNQKAADKRRRS